MEGVEVNESLFSFANDSSSASSTGISSTFQYYYHDIWQQTTSDPRINQLPLMEGGPWSVISVVAAYVYFVKVLGPEWMKKRQPFEIKPLIFAYNVLMIFVNLFFFVTVSVRTNFGIRTWTCMPVDRYLHDQEWSYMIVVGWFFVISKFVDLLDTIFFVLRKNFHQVSALHVIHHSMVPINCWLGLKYVPSESAAFMPFINSFIHAVMYSYYALSSLGPHMKPYLWWKRYLTSMQIIQLVLVTIHAAFLGFNSSCNLPRVMFMAGIPQVLLILYMFVDFYLKAYVRDHHHHKTSKLKEK